MTSAEKPADPSPECSTKGWKHSLGPIMGIVFWIINGVVIFNVFTKQSPKQQLAITNAGLHSVGKLARWLWQEEKMTEHPGETVFWTFAEGANFHIARRDKKPPKAGHASPRGAVFLPFRNVGLRRATQSAWVGAVLLMRHFYRTAEVRVNEADKTEFELTDL